MGKVLEGKCIKMKTIKKLVVICPGNNLWNIRKIKVCFRNFRGNKTINICSFVFKGRTHKDRR